MDLRAELGVAEKRIIPALARIEPRMYSTHYYTSIYGLPLQLV
jgi:hypothetical protein